jgi:hypothetical protein
VVPIAPFELVRATHNVKVTVTADPGDALNTKIGVTLAPTDPDDNPSYTGQVLTGTDGAITPAAPPNPAVPIRGSYSYTFPNVPFSPAGSPYVLTLTMPGDQLHTPTGLTCDSPTVPIPDPDTVGDPTTPAKDLTRTCTADVAVSSAKTLPAPDNTDNTMKLTYALHQAKVTISVAAKAGGALAGDPSPFPSTVLLTVRELTGTTPDVLGPFIYRNLSFSTTESEDLWLPVPPTGPIPTYRIRSVGPDGSETNASVGGNNWAGRLDVTRDVAATATDDAYYDWNLQPTLSTTTTTVRLVQVGGVVNFVVTAANGDPLPKADTAIIVLTPPPLPPPPDPPLLTGPTTVTTETGKGANPGGLATVDTFPVGPGTWTAMASTDGNAPYGDPFTFTVPATCTAASPCTVPLKLP